jgi:MFS family permease
LFSVGVITGCEIVALMIARPLFGRVSDKIGRTKPILAGIIASCIIVAAIPFTTSYPVLLALVIAYGVAFAAVLSSTSPLISELVRASLVGASMGFISTMMDIGQTLGPIVSGLIFASSLHYLGLFFSLSLMLAVSSIVFVLSKYRLKRRVAKDLIAIVPKSQ